MSAAVTTDCSTPVRFHRLTDEYGAFTNFSRHRVIIGHVVWETCEHYFQAAKFTDPDHAFRISQAPTPSRAAALGRTRSIPLRPDWDTARVDVMRTGMHAKFVQHPRLAHQLLATGDRPLIETTSDDWFWGCGHDGTGLNTTGQLLSEIRTDLPTLPTWAPPEVFSHRWVAFGEEIIVLPRPGRGRGDLSVQALRLLQLPSTDHDLPLDISTAGDDAYLRVQIPAAGEVLLRTPPTPAGPAAIAAALTRAAAEMITAAGDPRWPLPRS